MALKLTKPDDAYTPNLQDKRVQKRVSSVLAWCDSNLFEHQPTNIRAVTSTKKGPPSAKKLSITDVFGQQQNPLSKWLRYNLLIQSGIYHPGKLVYGYRLREGAVARIRSMMGETAIALSDLQKYEKKYQYELDTLEFNYREKSERLWHGLQNIRRSEKEEFWSKYLPYDYDISACAPNLLAQTARIGGLPAEKLAGVQRYLDEKGAFREHFSELSGLTLQQSKAVINSLFNGARLTPYYACSTFELLGYNRDALDRIKADQQVQEMLASIKEIWKMLKPIVQDVNGSKWNIYFRLEREVIDVVHEYLRSTSNAFFSEHDGWRCAKPVDTAALSALVLERTGYDLKFDKN